MRRLILLLATGALVAGCYPRYTKMEAADVPPARSEHRTVTSTPSFSAGPTQETTRTPDVAPDRYHN